MIYKNADHTVATFCIDGYTPVKPILESRTPEKEIKVLNLSQLFSIIRTKHVHNSILFTFCDKYIHLI